MLVAVFWAANFIVVKAATDTIEPVAFAFLRYVLASIVLLVLLRWREGDIRPPRGDTTSVLFLGALGFGVYQMLWTTGLRSIPAGDSALIIAATPVLTALLAVVAGSDSLTLPKLLGAAVSFAGVAIVIAAGPGLGSAGAFGAVGIGDLMTLTAAACFAIYTSWGAPILRRHSPLRTTTWAVVAGAVVLTPLGLVEASTTSWQSVTPGAWAGLLYSAAIPAGVANVVVFHAIRLLGPTRITAYQFLVPFIAVLLGAAFLSEPIRAEQIVGGAVIVAGVVLTRSGRRSMLLDKRA